MSAPDYRAAAAIVADDLMGRCQHLAFGLESHEIDGFDNNQEFCDVLDGLVWECKGCGWWTEPCEVDESDLCGECRGGDDGGDD